MNDELRVQIVELKKERDELVTEINFLKRALADETAEKYRCYSRLAEVTKTNTDK